MSRKLTLKDYVVTEEGKVFSPYRQIKPGIASNGYLTFNAGSDRTTLVHREVARRFIPNPLGKRTVNHKDGNKLNNNVSNLEWATDSENNHHAFSELNRKPSRGRMKITDDTARTILDMSKTLNLRTIAFLFEVPYRTVASIYYGTRKILD